MEKNPFERRRITKISLLFATSFLLLLIFIPSVLAADDSYKPYLHKAEVPDHPKVKLYGSYSTNLFPGAATYTYPIEVPRGTNGLQPTLSISYNNQNVKQSPGILGAGWSLTQNYIYRDVNSTVDNIADDKFKLILNDASYDLVYNASDGFYHTKIESYLRVQNLTGAPNLYGKYWLVTATDGTQYRFGYNNNSELASNTGKNYALRWSLDQVEDTHNNHIYYSYLEDPNPEDNGTVYISQILYNNDQQRKIEFAYESSARPDLRIAYIQGNLLKESRRLSKVNVSVNGNLVREYRFEYTNLNSEHSLSSLSKLKLYGSDGTSMLHQVSFDYYTADSGFTNYTTQWTSPLQFSSDHEDYGTRLVDLNNDGFVDIIRGRMKDSAREAFLNNKSGGWVNSSAVWAPPTDIVEYYYADIDYGVRFVDFNNDGLVDILRGSNSLGGEKKAWANNGSGWVDVSSVWAPPVNFVFNYNDTGTVLADINGDGRIDILQAGQTKSAYLNNGSGWVDASSVWNSPVYFMDWTNHRDTGARLEDINGDGLPDIIQSSNSSGEVRGVYLNNGTGWANYSSAWSIPVYFITDKRADNGVRFADLNNDGLTDIFADYANISTTEKAAWINNGTGWVQSDSWQPPEPFTKDGYNIGRRLADVNGDGLADIVIAHTNSTGSYAWSWIKNSTKPYMLKTITNELGGMTSIDYQNSTHFNNTGSDGLSGIGFNIWVVEDADQDNSMQGTFGVVSNYSYSFLGGMYDYKNSEFRGFNQVNESRPDGTKVIHYFHQNDALKGKEYRTEVYDINDNPYSKDEYAFNYTNSTLSGGNLYRVLLASQASYLYDGSTSNPRITAANYTYDTYGNVVNKTYLGDVSKSGDEKYELYSYVYNTSAWILNKPSKNSLYASDGSTKVKDTKYSYDGRVYGSAPAKGDATQVENWLDTPSDGGNPITMREYDSYGNVIRQTNPRGYTTAYTYGIRDPTYTYTDKVTNALGQSTDYSYDIGTGNLQWEMSNGINKTYYYDVFGRIVKEVQPYDTYDFPTKSYSYSFDGTAPESIKVSSRISTNKTFDIYYFYDGFANFIQLKNPSDGGNQVVKNIFYDSSGRVRAEQNPYFDSFSISLATSSSSVKNTTYIYDSLSRVVRVDNPDTTNKTINFDHSAITAYDENGHRKTYVLDAYDRITNVLEYNNDPVLRFNYESDVYNTTYHYDTADNLIRIVDALGNVFNFTYDSLGRRIQLTDPDIGTWTYTYDVAGNLIKQEQNGGGNLVTGDGYYREYDGSNQLIRIRSGSTASSPVLEEYTYDPFGQRIKIDRNDTANTTIYTPFKELMRIVNSTGAYDYTYIYQDSVLVARINPDGSKYFYHPDHLGSTTLITDESGNVVEQTFYSPYGEVTGGGTKDVKLYTGQFSDSVLCQYYYGKRYFSPCWGIFIQADPLIKRIYNPQNLNRYSYVFSNPYKYTDVNGLWAFQAGVGGSIGWIMGINGEGGVVVSYDELEGYQFGLYGSYGIGGIIEGLSGQVGGSFSPNAKVIKDIEGSSFYYGGEIAFGIFAGGVGVSYPFADNKVDTSKGPNSYSAYYSPGAEISILGLKQETYVLPLASISNKGIQVGQSSNAEVVSEQQTKQTTEKHTETQSTQGSIESTKTDGFIQYWGKVIADWFTKYFW